MARYIFKRMLSLLPTLLGIAFVILKLMGAIAWPWAWVLLPLLIKGTIIALTVIRASLIFGIAGVMAWIGR